MDLKERIDINIVDLINRIDRLTSGNVGHAKTQLKFQIKKVGEFVTELCDNQKSDTGDRQLTIPVVINWVSVTERMPPRPDEDYLVVMRNKNKEGGVALQDVKNFTSDGTWVGGNNWENVVAWAELPEPPYL